MRRVISLIPLLSLVLTSGGCNPYVAAVSAVSQTYNATTDVRSLSTQVSDDEIEAKIKAALVQSPVSGTGSLGVTCRQGVVVIDGVVPPGSDAGHAAVRIARDTAGVSRVETFFVSYRPSTADDLELKAKVKEAFVADSDIIAGQVDIDVYAGHVILIGVVSNYDQVEEFVGDANGVDGVVSVRSYIQLPKK